MAIVPTNNNELLSLIHPTIYEKDEEQEEYKDLVPTPDDNGENATPMVAEHNMSPSEGEYHDSEVLERATEEYHDTLVALSSSYSEPSDVFSKNGEINSVDEQATIENKTAPAAFTPQSLRSTLNNFLQHLQGVVDPERTPGEISSAKTTPPEHHIEIPIIISTFDMDEHEKSGNKEEEVVSETKGVDISPKTPSNPRRPKWNRKLPKKYQGPFLTDNISTGSFQQYSMCMVCDRITTPENHIIERKDPSTPAIFPDAYTPLLQKRFGITPTNVQDTSVGNTKILYYVFMQYLFRQGLKAFPVKGKKALRSECT